VPPRPDRNFWLLVGDAGLFSLAAVCFDASVVLPVFVAQFTTSPLLIGAPAAIRLGGLYLPQLPAALSIRRFQHIKGFLMWQVVVGRAALLACIPAALLAGGLSPEAVLAIVLIAFAVFAFTEGAATLAWLDLVGDVIHSRLRGRYFGVVQLLGGLASVGAGFGVRSLLGDAVAPPDFVPLFAWGLVGFFASAGCIALVREPRGAIRAVPDEPTLTHVIGLLRGGHLVRLGLAQILAGSLQLALPFYVLFGRDRLGLTTDWLGSFIVAQTVGASVAALVWARVAERYGARLVISLSAGVLVLIPPVALLSERAGGGALMLVVFGLAGAANGGSRSGFWQYVLDLVPARDRRVFMGLANTANAPSLLMPIIGGLLLDWGGYNWLLAGSVLGGLGATISGLWLAAPRPEEPPIS
jgi:MFS family permease